MDQKHLKELKELGDTYKEDWKTLCHFRVFTENVLDKSPWHMAILAEVLLANKSVDSWADFEKNYLSRVKHKTREQAFNDF
jgi:hypothetical protein